MNNQPIPFVKGIQKNWVIGWKATTAYLRESGEFVFMPLIIKNLQYTIDDTACCYHRGHTKPPYDDCRCGFNAWHDIAQALDYMEPYARHHDSRGNYVSMGTYMLPLYAWNFTMVMLRVGLYGDVIDAIEPAWGYRAEKQRVADVFFNERCAYCQNFATVIGVMNAEYPVPYWMSEEMPASRLLWQLCSIHENLALYTFSASELNAINGVNVHLGYPTPD